MRRKHPINQRQPGLFDSLDQDYAEQPADGFEFIPPQRMERIVRAHTPAIDPLPPLTEDNHVFFMSFGSGSSGNCAYVGDRRCGFLVDAGIDAHRVVKTLRDNGITMDRVAGIILTHDHHDHISQAYALLRQHRHMRLYCTPRALGGILRRHNISRRIKDYHTPIYKEFPFKIGEFEITAFEVKHDGTDNAGFHIAHSGHRLTIATDLGCISDRVDHYMRLAHAIVIESNYDQAMLRNGTYPEYLKARILADNGHLDNADTARYLSSILTDGLRHVFLCHLSHDNNTPRLAVDTVTAALGPATRFEVIPLPRYDSTPLYTLF